MQLERAFIDPQGLPGRPLARYTYYKELNTTVCKCTFSSIYEIFYLYLVFFPSSDTFFLRRAVSTPTPEAVSQDQQTECLRSKVARMNPVDGRSSRNILLSFSIPQNLLHQRSETSISLCLCNCFHFVKNSFFKNLKSFESLIVDILYIFDSVKYNINVLKLSFRM